MKLAVDALLIWPLAGLIIATAIHEKTWRFGINFLVKISIEAYHDFVSWNRYLMIGGVGLKLDIVNVLRLVT